MRRDWLKISVWTAGLAWCVLVWCLLVVALACVAAVMFNPPPAQAHPLPKATNVTVGLHKICKTVKLCYDKPPRPRINCGWNNRGQREVTYDPNLDANVTWRCDCPWGKYGNCLWVRVMIQPVPADWMIPTTRHHVWDFQRKCASLVCIGVRVDHFYRSLRYYPNTVSDA